MSQNQQEQSEAKLLAYIEGELDAAGRAEIEKHLEVHPQHRRLLEEMRSMRDWLRWLPKETAPAELAESFQMRLERTMLLDDAGEDAARPRMRIDRWPQLRAAAAVAALAVALGAIIYLALPSRHSQFTTAPPAPRPPRNALVALGLTPTTDASKLADATDQEKQAQTRESDGAERLADAGSRERKQAATPATAPADAETALAKGLSAEELRKSAAEGAEREVAALAAGSPSTAPALAESALAEAGKKTSEPTEQLARIARDTYSLVSDDPALIALLRTSNSKDSLAERAADAPASFGAAAADAARAERMAERTPSAGSTDSTGSTSSPQARSLQAGSPSSLRAGLGQASQAARPFVMVVLAADTDRAHKQIGDYLAANGIETRSVNDGYSRRLLDEGNAAKPRGNATPAAPHPASSISPAAPPEAPAPSGGAAAPAWPAAPPAAAPRAPAPPVAAATPAPPAAAPTPWPFARNSPQQPAGQAPRAPAMPAATQPLATPAPVVRAVPETDQKPAAAKGSIANGGGPLDAPDANGNIFIARRMTARQARELQATLRQPAALQWAAVYCQPSDGSNPPRQLGDFRAASPPALGLPARSPPAVRPSNPPAVRPSNPSAVRPSNPSTAPAVSLSNPSNPSHPASRPAPGQAPGTQAAALADGLPQKGQAFKYAAAGGEAQAARRSPGEALDKDKANIPAAGPEQELRARGAATTRPADRWLAGGAGPTKSPAGAPSPGGAGGAGGGRDQLERTTPPNKRDVPTTAPSGRSATQPNDALFLEQDQGASRDDQPVDVVIVLRQSPETATTQPAAK